MPPTNCSSVEPESHLVICTLIGATLEGDNRVCEQVTVHVRHLQVIGGHHGPKAVLGEDRALRYRLTLAGAAGHMTCAATPAGDGPGYNLPGHLPKKLSIGMFIWNWVTMAAPGEPYFDLENVVAGLPQRGFNAVRADAGLNWCFRMDGQPRGEMDFGPWIAGYRDNLTTVNVVGGGRHDVLKRMVCFMELAKRYGVYVILTSWEYQDSSWLVADPKIRAEVMAVPQEKRFMHLARQHDRLLRVLKDKGIHRNIAFVEVHNEPDASLFPARNHGQAAA